MAITALVLVVAGVATIGIGTAVEIGTMIAIGVVIAMTGIAATIGGMIVIAVGIAMIEIAIEIQEDIETMIGERRPPSDEETADSFHFSSSRSVDATLRRRDGDTPDDA
jgi:hypothetical protein